MTAPADELSVLVADDEEGIRELTMHWLGQAGHRVAAADSGRAASALLKSQRFDIVVTDVVMPDGDGFELIAQVRRLHPATRILAISGGGKYLQGSDCLRMAQGLGAHGIVMKPFTREQFLAGFESLRTPVAG
jgi:CheY-like chemotaxis protein